MKFVLIAKSLHLHLPAVWTETIRPFRLVDSVNLLNTFYYTNKLVQIIFGLLW